MNAEFENAIEELKLEFPKFKEILMVVLFGSVARGDFSRRHSDLDLLVIINKKTIGKKIQEEIKNKASEICIKFGVRSHIEFQGLNINTDDKSLLRKMIEEGKVIYSRGAWFIEDNILGLKQYVIYSFSTKKSKKGTTFSKALHGKRSWYYKGKEKIIKEYPGIADNDNIILIGKGGIMIKKDKQKYIETLFQEFNIEYKIKKIVYA